MRHLDYNNIKVSPNAMFGSTSSIGLEYEPAVNDWYSEYFHYDYDKPAITEENHNFAQMLWKEATGVGCCKRTCTGVGKVILCQYDHKYDPSSLSRNVGPLILDKATITETVIDFQTITNSKTITELQASCNSSPSMYASTETYNNHQSNY